MMRILIFLCITAVISAQNSRLHEKMTDDEIFQLFGTTPNSVPEYEVVPIGHTRHPRSLDHRILQLTSFSRDMRFYLEPTNGYLAGVKTPVFKARKNTRMPNGVEFEKIPGAISKSYKTYQDPINNAAIFMKYDRNGRPLVHGIINHPKESYAIRPLLPRFRNSYKLHKRHASHFSNHTLQYPELEYAHDHIVYKIPNESYNRQQKERKQLENNQIRRGVDIDIDRDNQVPNIVYPQVLIVVETSLFKRFQRDVDEVVKYILAYWNGVDLRYRVYLEPEVRLNIAGIILAEDSSMTPYIKANLIRVDDHQENKTEVKRATKHKARFFFTETDWDDNTMVMRRLEIKYDIAITMTTLDLCDVELCNEEVKTECTTTRQLISLECVNLGYAYTTGACSYDPNLKLVQSVGIVEDGGSFSGIIPTAHEVGHLLGASHSPVNKHNCTPNDGYLMSVVFGATYESFIWSNCTARSVIDFFKKESRAQCMFNKPDTGNEIPRLLPGEVYSREQICDRVMKTTSCEEQWYRNHCVHVYCKRSDVCTAVKDHTVPEGSSCGDGKICINAECVPKYNAYVHLQLGTTTPKPV